MGLRQTNLLMLRKLVVVALGMFGFGYALVPLYVAICEATGINILALGEKELPGLATHGLPHRKTANLIPAAPSPWSLMPMHVVLGISSPCKTRFRCILARWRL